MPFFTIAMKLGLVVPKINKKIQNKISEKFTRQLHFLKSCKCCNIHDAFGAKSFYAI